LPKHWIPASAGTTHFSLMSFRSKGEIFSLAEERDTNRFLTFPFTMFRASVHRNDTSLDSRLHVNFEVTICDLKDEIPSPENPP